MKKNLLFAVSIAIFGLLSSTFVFAQNDKIVSAAGDTYVISAKAGGVNYVEGKVSVVHEGGKNGLLQKNDVVVIGDKVLTGADGKAEILLNPGSFVRLGANTEFGFQTIDLDDLKLKLSGGSAIFEVYADDEFKVSLDLPKADIELTKSGVYRVDVLADGSGKISVWKGKVIVGDEKAE
ncbi:MAG TPA: FecR family protein, partial [Pyrinomonadaceae bacterium]|nr:FecR family protein [Pyrinomonadaceae bacterium]